MPYLKKRVAGLRSPFSALPAVALSVILAAVLAVSGLSGLSGCVGNAAASDGTAPSGGQPAPSATPIEGRLAIIHTNDTHGYDMPADPGDSTPGVIGMAAVAQLKKDYEEQGYQVLLLDAGDATQDNVLVNLSQGASAMAFMNSAGYDAMAVGNHEFDWGADNLEALIGAADFPVLAANIIVETTGEPFVQPHAIFELDGGAKVGVFGLATPETQTKSLPRNTAGLVFLAGEDMYQCAQEQADYLRGQGCALVIALCHLGGVSGAAPNRSFDVASNTTGIDLFIDGHDHEVVNNVVGDALVVSTGCHLENIGLVLYEDGVCTERMVTYGSYVGRDPATEALISATNDEVDAQLAETIGSTTVALDGNRVPGVRTQETNLGDFAADAMLWQATQALGTTADAAIVNGGNIRDSIGVGDISMKTMMTVFPYNNSLNVVTLTGAQLLEALEASAFSTPEGIGGFPQVAGIVYHVDTSVPYQSGEQYPNSTYYAPAAPGSRVTISDVGGRGFSLDEHYVLALNNFITGGGDTYYVVAQAYQETGYAIGYTDTDALINYLQTELGGTIGSSYAAPQGRITVR
jgi:5'-nucleotidase